MKHYLIIIFCCFCKTVLAQSNFIQIWEQQALTKGTSWSYETRMATAANNQRFTSLYVNGRYVASFRDAATCRLKISELKQLAEQMFTRNSTSTSKQPSQEYYDTMRSLGKSKAEVDAGLKKIKDEVGKVSDSNQTKNKQELLEKVENSCSCRTEQNPNYDSNAKPYEGIGDSFEPSGGNKVEIGNQSGFLFGESTQYDNIFDAPSGRNITFTTQTTEPTVSLNFDDMGKYTSGVVFDVDNLSELVVDYRPSGIIAPEIPISESLRSAPIASLKNPDNTAKKQDKTKDWIDLGLDATKFGAGVVLKATSTAGVLVVVNVNLYKELVKAWDNPEYMGLSGTGKIFLNTIKNSAIDVGIGVAIDNSAKIAGAYSKAVKAEGGIPATLSIKERRILVGGKKVLEAGTMGYDTGGIIVKGHDLTVSEEDKWNW